MQPRAGFRSISRPSTAKNPFALSDETRQRLARRLGAAIGRARSEAGPAVAAVTAPLPAQLDLSAAVLGARRPDERFFCFEQPERDGFVLAGLGQATVL